MALDLENYIPIEHMYVQKLTLSWHVSNLRRYPSIFCRNHAQVRHSTLLIVSHGFLLHTYV